MDITENLTGFFLKGKGQSYAMHDMDRAMMFSTYMRLYVYDVYMHAIMYGNVMFMNVCFCLGK